MTPRDARAEAVAWLVGRLRFEQLLHDLQHPGDGSGAVAADDADVVATPKAA
jgi:hypothetical protein